MENPDKLKSARHLKYVIITRVHFGFGVLGGLSNNNSDGYEKVT